jgi:hypothetical protein
VRLSCDVVARAITLSCVSSKCRQGRQECGGTALEHAAPAWRVDAHLYRHSANPKKNNVRVRGSTPNNAQCAVPLRLRLATPHYTQPARWAGTPARCTCAMAQLTRLALAQGSGMLESRDTSPLRHLNAADSLKINRACQCSRAWQKKHS